MKTRTQRKTSARRPIQISTGSIQKFMLPPVVLVFRELRRLEEQDRQFHAVCLHHID